MLRRNQIESCAFLKTNLVMEAFSCSSCVCLQVSKTRPRALLLNTTKPGVSAHRYVLWYNYPDLRVWLQFSKPPFPPGQTAGPGSQQTSSPDYAWVDFYRQPMAYFNQGAPQTQAPGLQVRSSSRAVSRPEDLNLTKLIFSKCCWSEAIDTIDFQS